MRQRPLFSGVALVNDFYASQLPQPKLFPKGALRFMAMTMALKINGFRFVFNLEFGGDGGGVVLTPDVDIHSPNFIGSLQKAFEILPMLEMGAYWESYAGGYLQGYSEAQLRSHLYNAPDEHLQDIVKAREVLEDSADDIFSITPLMLKYADFVAIEIIRRRQKQQKERVKAEKKQSKSPGYVYLVRSSTGAYKIGRTVNPDNRMKTFSVKLPFEVSYECLIQTDDMVNLELKLHKRFEHRRVNGEWFNLDASDIEYIKGLVS